MVTKQRAQAGSSNRLASLATLEGNEQRRRVRSGSFELDVACENLAYVACQRQDSLPVAFATNEELAFGKPQILDPELDGFLGAQTIKKHQSDEAEVSESAKAGAET